MWVGVSLFACLFFMMCTLHQNQLLVFFLSTGPIILAKGMI